MVASAPMMALLPSRCPRRAAGPTAKTRRTSRMSNPRELRMAVFICRHTIGPAPAR